MTPEELADRMSKSWTVEKLLDALDRAGRSRTAEEVGEFLLHHAEMEIEIAKDELAILGLLND